MATSGYKRRGTTTSRKRNKRSTKRSSCSAGPGAGYRSVTCTFRQKISSYQTLWKQTRGSATYTRPSPMVLNTLARWVDRGAVIHTVSSTQIARWSKTGKKYSTAASAKSALCSQFGKTPIKCVARDKTGKFLVATPNTWKGKTFRFPR